jgi:hypothetical protein
MDLFFDEYNPFSLRPRERIVVIAMAGKTSVRRST